MDDNLFFYTRIENFLIRNTDTKGNIRTMKTKAIKKEKQFDAVKTMREIRDQFSKEIMNMTFAEEKAYLKKLLKKKTTSAA